LRFRFPVSRRPHPFSLNGSHGREVGGEHPCSTIQRATTAFQRPLTILGRR
jgi:hypothetical protein